MELIDVYDRNGNRTGKVVERGTSLLEGEYILAVGMWIVDSQNRIFLTKRSSEKHFAPNKWENPAGHVQAGESCMDAVLREFKELIIVTLQMYKKTSCHYSLPSFFNGYNWFR